MVQIPTLSFTCSRAFDKSCNLSEPPQVFSSVDWACVYTSRVLVRTICECYTCKKLVQPPAHSGCTTRAMRMLQGSSRGLTPVHLVRSQTDGRGVHAAQAAGHQWSPPVRQCSGVSCRKRTLLHRARPPRMATAAKFSQVSDTGLAHHLTQPHPFISLERAGREPHVTFTCSRSLSNPKPPDLTAG